MILPEKWASGRARMSEWACPRAWPSSHLEDLKPRFPGYFLSNVPSNGPEATAVTVASDLPIHQAVDIDLLLAGRSLEVDTGGLDGVVAEEVGK